ncbi:MUCEN protein, partial [Rhinopomastus cyanomelas]|nr:MUCEN protein [Rhinopomastus cyanomelas]
FAGVILPVVITMIAATLVAFSGAALYRLCQKKTPGIWFVSLGKVKSDKEGVKLLSVKTTSPETGEWYICVCVC